MQRRLKGALTMDKKIKNDLRNYAILEIPDLKMTSSMIQIENIMPELFFSLGNKRLTFRCVRITPSEIFVGKKPKGYECGRIGWYEFYKID